MIKTMRQIKQWLPIAGLVLCFTFASNAAVVDIQSIVKNLVGFDGKSVTIRGTAAEVNKTKSRRGNPYTTFQAQGAGAAIKVFTFGHPGIENGDCVEVTGVFHHVWHVPPNYTFYDEIEAQSVTPIAC
jgi:hypothetical protein